MKSRMLTVTMLAVLALLEPAAAHIWNPTPQQQAQDYSSINHNKSGTGGRVVISWMAAPAFTGGNLPIVLEKYLVLTVTHTITAPTGLSEYEDIEGVNVTDQAGHALKQIDANDVPPTIVSILASLDATLRQSTQGRGKMKAMVFEAGAVHACDKNAGLIVTFEGEKYTWDTPFPGCNPPASH